MGKHKKKKPEIRFKGFTDDWEQRKFEDLFAMLQNNTLSRAELSDEEGCALNVHYGDVLVKYNEILDVANSNLPMAVSSDIIEKYKSSYLQDGDVVIADTAEDESVGKCCEIAGAGDNIILAGLHTMPVRPTIKFASRYLGFYLNAPSYHRQLITLMQGTKVTSISKSSIKNTTVLHPNEYEEQNQIGEYFDKLDNLITLHQRKLEKLKKVKKSMLEKMFLQNGEMEPQIRFCGFNSTWEQRKLGEICDSFEYGLNVAATDYDGENKYIRITDIDDNSHGFLQNDVTSPDIDLSGVENYKLKQGDILFARTGASVGKTYIYKESDGLVYYAGFLIRGRVKDEYSPEFVFQNTLTGNYDRFIRITSQRSGQPGVNAQEYASYQIAIPVLAEQQKLGAYFSHLDHLITLHQRKLEKLKKMKKAMLEKMFV